MMLRQEAALDRSIDRKVSLLLRLRKEAADRPIAPPGDNNGAGMENVEQALDSDIMSDGLQSVEAVENLKMNEQCENIIENTGLRLDALKSNGDEKLPKFGH